jgi:hypothetical protein
VGSKSNPIVISDDEEVQQRRRSLNEIRCGECNEKRHFMVDCTKEYRSDDEEEQYTPIPDTEDVTTTDYTFNTGRN